jgi:hypothetical protein
MGDVGDACGTMEVRRGWDVEEEDGEEGWMDPLSQS